MQGDNSLYKLQNLEGMVGSGDERSASRCMVTRTSFVFCKYVCDDDAIPDQRGSASMCGLPFSEFE